MLTDKEKRYQKIKRVGEGQFAYVYQAKDSLNDEIVAIKKFKLVIGGRPGDAKQEMNFLKQIKHDNIVQLKDIIGEGDDIQLVMDYMETDLEIIVRGNKLNPAHIKNIMHQLFVGVEHLHSNWILHRDLKPNNLLLNSAGCLKISDFGMARYFENPPQKYTNLVVTRWYRSPELLFGMRKYGTGVDIWACACIFGELFLRHPLFIGESDISQLTRIFDVLGVPNEQDWPELKSLPYYMEFEDAQKYTLQDIFPKACENTLSLMSSCFAFNPDKRATAKSALESPYFKCEPFACHDEQIPGIDGIQNVTVSWNDENNNEELRPNVPKFETDYVY
uniref:Protein kinase domain-containing protein n=1 Tax=Panagrolaimus sp. PS1159 TaxID=55785 RepID=A0AC35F7W7_9BILA